MNGSNKTDRPAAPFIECPNMFYVVSTAYRIVLYCISISIFLQIRKKNDITCFQIYETLLTVYTFECARSTYLYCRRVSPPSIRIYYFMLYFRPYEQSSSWKLRRQRH
jgi:hypothetical protein